MRPPASNIRSNGCKRVRSRHVIMQRWRHGAVRRLRRRLWKMQTSHRSVATTFTTWLLVLCPILAASAQDITSTLQPRGEPVATTFEVIVTGSLIPTAEEVSPNPVFIINRDLINKSGAGTTTEQLLQRQPVMNGANIPVQNS